MAEKSTGFKRNRTNIWEKYSYFKQQPPEMSIFYLNQGYQSYKDNKKLFYVDYFIVGQVNQCLNPTENLSSYEFKENEAKIYCPRYDTVTSQFIGLCKTMAYVVVRSDSDKCCFDCSYSKENSKILHSFHKKKDAQQFQCNLFQQVQDPI